MEMAGVSVVLLLLSVAGSSVGGAAPSVPVTAPNLPLIGQEAPTEAPLAALAPSISSAVDATVQAGPQVLATKDSHPFGIETPVPQYENPFSSESSASGSTNPLGFSLPSAQNTNPLGFAAQLPNVQMQGTNLADTFSIPGYLGVAAARAASPVTQGAQNLLQTTTARLLPGLNSTSTALQAAVTGVNSTYAQVTTPASALIQEALFRLAPTFAPALAPLPGQVASALTPTASAATSVASAGPAVPSALRAINQAVKNVAETASTVSDNVNLQATSLVPPMPVGVIRRPQSQPAPADASDSIDAAVQSSLASSPSASPASSPVEAERAALAGSPLGAGSAVDSLVPAPADLMEALAAAPGLAQAQQALASVVAGAGAQGDQLRGARGSAPVASPLDITSAAGALLQASANALDATIGTVAAPTLSQLMQGLSPAVQGAAATPQKGLAPAPAQAEFATPATAPAEATLIASGASTALAAAQLAAAVGKELQGDPPHGTGHTNVKVAASPMGLTGTLTTTFSPASGPATAVTAQLALGPSASAPAVSYSEIAGLGSVMGVAPAEAALIASGASTALAAGQLAAAVGKELQGDPPLGTGHTNVKVAASPMGLTGTLTTTFSPASGPATAVKAQLTLGPSASAPAVSYSGNAGLGSAVGASTADTDTAPAVSSAGVGGMSASASLTTSNQPVLGIRVNSDGTAHAISGAVSSAGEDPPPTSYAYPPEPYLASAPSLGGHGAAGASDDNFLGDVLDKEYRSPTPYSAPAAKQGDDQQVVPSFAGAGLKASSPSTARAVPTVTAAPRGADSSFGDSSAGADPYEIRATQPKAPTPAKQPDLLASLSSYQPWVTSNPTATIPGRVGGEAPPLDTADDAPAPAPSAPLAASDTTIGDDLAYPAASSLPGTLTSVSAVDEATTPTVSDAVSDAGPPPLTASPSMQSGNAGISSDTARALAGAGTSRTSDSAAAQVIRTVGSNTITSLQNIAGALPIPGLPNMTAALLPTSASLPSAANLFDPATLMGAHPAGSELPSRTPSIMPQFPGLGMSFRSHLYMPFGPGISAPAGAPETAPFGSGAPDPKDDKAADAPAAAPSTAVSSPVDIVAGTRQAVGKTMFDIQTTAAQLEMTLMDPITNGPATHAVIDQLTPAAAPVVSLAMATGAPAMKSVADALMGTQSSIAKAASGLLSSEAFTLPPAGADDA